MERHAPTRFYVKGLIVSTAALTVAGIAAVFLDLGPEARFALMLLCVAAFAGVAGFALGVSYYAARSARRLMGQPQSRGSFWVAIFCSAVCAAVSVAGVHLAWILLVETASAALRAHLPPWWMIDIGGFLLGVVKPAMGWVTEDCEQLDLAEQRSAEAADAARREARDAADRQMRHQERLAEIAAQGRAARRPPAPADQGPQRGRVAEPAAAERPMLTVVGGAKEAELAARRLIGEGVRRRNELCRRAGVSKGVAARLLDELAPGWREAA